MTDHPLVHVETLVLIAIGGFVGANARYFVGAFLPGMPGTFVVNVVGSTVLGFVLFEARYLGVLGARTRLVFATGFLSSFTTYSTFALETVQAAPLLGALNVVGSYALGIGGVLVGERVAALVSGGREPVVGGE